MLVQTRINDGTEWKACKDFYECAKLQVAHIVADQNPSCERVYERGHGSESVHDLSQPRRNGAGYRFGQNKWTRSTVNGSDGSGCGSGAMAVLVAPTTAFLVAEVGKDHPDW